MSEKPGRQRGSLTSVGLQTLMYMIVHIYAHIYIYIHNHIHNHIPIDTNNYINTVTYLHIHRLYIKYIRIHVHTQALVHVHSVLTWHQATSPAAPCLLVTRQVTPAKNCCGARVGPQKGERKRENWLVVFNPRNGSWHHQREKFTRSFFYFSDVFWIISQLILIFDRVSAVDKPSHLCTVLPHKKGCLISLIVDCLYDWPDCTSTCFNEIILGTQRQTYWTLL